MRIVWWPLSFGPWALLAGTSWSDLVLPTMVVGIAFLFFATQYRVFNAMMMGDEAALTLGIPLRFYWYLYDHGGCADSSLSGNLWDYWICWSHYSSLSSRLVGTNYKKTFSRCDLTGCPLCRMGRCTLSSLFQMLSFDWYFHSLSRCSLLHLHCRR